MASSGFGFPVPIAMSEYYYCHLLHLKGDGKGCNEHAKNLITHAEKANQKLFLAFGWYLLGNGYHLIGAFSAAKEHIEHGIGIMTENKITLNLCHFYYGLSLAHFDSSDFKNACECAQKGLELSKTYNEKLYEGFLRISLGRVLAKMDTSPSGEGIASISKGMAICEKSGQRPILYQGCLFLGELYTDTGQNEKAIENLTKAEFEFGNMGMRYWQARTYGAFAEFYNKQGNQSDAKENLGKAIAIFKECGADGWVEKYGRSYPCFHKIQSAPVRVFFNFRQSRLGS